MYVDDVFGSNNTILKQTTVRGLERELKICHQVSTGIFSFQFIWCAGVGRLNHSNAAGRGVYSLKFNSGRSRLGLALTLGVSIDGPVWRLPANE